MQIGNESRYVGLSVPTINLELLDLGASNFYVQKVFFFTIFEMNLGTNYTRLLVFDISFACIFLKPAYKAI